MAKRKLTFTIDAELIKEFKILAVNLDVTMTSLVEESIIDMIDKKKKKNYTTFNKYSIKEVPIQKTTQTEREDITTVDAVLPMRDLTEV